MPHSLVLNEMGRATAVLHRLREHGIRVANDDFGSGYSALSNLRDLPIDELKLDRHFIASVTEDAATADSLREHDCDIGQGYYFGRPVTASEIPQLIEMRAALTGSPDPVHRPTSAPR